MYNIGVQSCTLVQGCMTPKAIANGGYRGESVLFDDPSQLLRDIFGGGRKTWNTLLIERTSAIAQVDPGIGFVLCCAHELVWGLLETESPIHASEDDDALVSVIDEFYHNRITFFHVRAPVGVDCTERIKRVQVCSNRVLSNPLLLAISIVIFVLFLVLRINYRVPTLIGVVLIVILAVVQVLFSEDLANSIALVALYVLLAGIGLITINYFLDLRKQRT